jgi:hypothetical protein
MPLLPWLCIEICVCLVCLLQQSFCKTQSRTQTSGNTFTTILGENNEVLNF